MALGSATTKGSATGSRGPSVWLRIKQFIVEAWQELRKVLWPSRREATRFTIVVLAVTVLVAVFIYVCDFALTQLSGPIFNIWPTK